MHDEASVEGTYRPNRALLKGRRWWWLSGFAMVFIALGIFGVVDALIHRQFVTAAGRSCTVLVWLWLVWGVLAQGTIVTSDGVRVRLLFRSRFLTWDEIASVPEPSKWSPTQMLSVVTTTGEQVRLHVPDQRWADFAAYADAHRSTGRHGAPIDRGPNNH